MKPRKATDQKPQQDPEKMYLCGRIVITHDAVKIAKRNNLRIPPDKELFSCPYYSGPYPRVIDLTRFEDVYVFQSDGSMPRMWQAIRKFTKTN